MPCILALDIGGKRTGLAITDETKTFAFPLETIQTSKLMEEIGRLACERPLDSIVAGLPKNLNNENTHNTARVEQTIKKLRQQFPALQIFTVDERFTSKMAKQAMLMGGMKKMNRQNKENTDKLSATIILQSFLEQQSRLGPMA